MQILTHFMKSWESVCESHRKWEYFPRKKVLKIKLGVRHTGNSKCTQKPADFEKKTPSELASNHFDFEQPKRLRPCQKNEQLLKMKSIA